MTDWAYAPRTKRLSTAAINLLARLCQPGECITFERLAGQYRLTDMQIVPSKTVDVLAAPRLIIRDKSTARPVYVISDRGREIVNTYESREASTDD